jgi:hypothetical protein
LLERRRLHRASRAPWRLVLPTERSTHADPRGAGVMMYHEMGLVEARGFAPVPLFLPDAAIKGERVYPSPTWTRTRRSFPPRWQRRAAPRRRARCPHPGDVLVGDRVRVPGDLVGQRAHRLGQSCLVECNRALGMRRPPVSSEDSRDHRVARVRKIRHAVPAVYAQHHRGRQGLRGADPRSRFRRARGS